MLIQEEMFTHSNSFPKLVPSNSDFLRQHQDEQLPTSIEVLSKLYFRMADHDIINESDHMRYFVGKMMDRYHNIVHAQ